MVTVAATSSTRQPVAVGVYDRVFYSGMAIAMAITVFIGFAPTYYLRPVLGPRPTVTGATTLTTLAHVHGALFSAWVALFIVQTALVANRRTRVHQRMGIAGAMLAASMIVIGVSATIAAAARGAAPPGADPLGFMIVPLTDMALFATFIGLALWRRRDREAHKRLMLLAYISMLAAAFARFPGVLPLGPFVFFGLAFVFLLIGVAYDVATRGRVHPVYIWGGLLLAVSVPARLMLSTTPAWMAFATFLTR